ncbi:hypothetical protein ZIOFF_005229 [Zingiber officinale]|uniref:Trehalose 6-phosphate phosphatase n=1 Tax=Zingiber officinale TaxID=94328 RepID=A0A8J5HM56_ZINOF|nr:hypothetical protein ZIOFF_005229 [Zingiber officinale]
MTKQNVVPAEAVATVTVVAAGSSPIFPYPPPISIPNKYVSQFDLVSGRTSSWLESMKASSPTHPKVAAALAASVPIVDSVFKVRSGWTMWHPSALSQFDQIVRASKGKQIVMFLDYDGTLSPIVEDPDSAFMSNAMRKAVREVARDFPTAIVSGRCLDKVVDFVKLAELYYAGSHGMDIKGPEKSRHAKVYKTLLDRTKSTPGVKVENNKFCASVHFRCVDEKVRYHFTSATSNWGSLIDQVRSVLKEYPRLRLTQGRKVLEIRPTIKWDKGKALEFLLESLGFANCKDVMPIYIGDDHTDEDAFKVGEGLLDPASRVEASTSEGSIESVDWIHAAPPPMKFSDA